MRTKINADFQAGQFSVVAARMRTVARDKRRLKEDKLEEIAALGVMLVRMAKMNAEHWEAIVEELEM